MPCTIFEDAGPFTKKLSCNVVSFGGLFGRGGDKLSQFPICAYLKVKESADDHAAMWSPILKDFEDLAIRGVGPWKFFLLFAKSDLEVRTVSWGLPSYNGPQPCTECLADRDTSATGNPFTDLRPGASWRRTELASTEAFLARARLPLHPLLTSSFFWRGFLPLDAMHLLDCHGVTNNLGGSIIHYLVQSCHALGRNQQVRMLAINTRMADWQRGQPGISRMPPLRLSNLVENEWSCLSGPVVKAANTRALTPFLQILAQECFTSGSEYDRLVQRVVKCLCRVYELLYSAGIFFLPDELAELRRCLIRFGTAWQQLRAIASRNGLMQWHMSPKLHISQHLATQAAIMNPRYCQNYTEESCIGSTTAVWRRSAVGRYRASAQRLVLIKRVVALFIRFEGILPADE